MSRTGSKEIQLNNAKITVDKSSITVTGSKGVLNLPNFDCLSVDVSEKSVKLNRNNDLRNSKEKHGLLRSLLHNAVFGVTKGYTYNMYLQGIGYRVQLKGSDLEFSLGYSHSVLFKASHDVQFKVDGVNKFSVFSINKELLGQVCADIKRLRKKDSYKGKGIFFEGEIPKKKPGKSIKK